jgi:ketosteroid isomerase-like protein
MGGAAMSPAEKKTLVLETWQAFAAYDNETAFKHIHPDVEWHLPGVPGFPAKGIAKLAEMSEYGKSAYQGVRTMEIRNCWCDGDTVILEYKSEGMRTNGNAYVNDYVSIFDLVGDQIVSIRQYFDTLVAARSAGKQ